MEISGKQIAQTLEKIVKKQVKILKKQKKKPKLVVFLVGKSDQQLSFVRIKKKEAKKLCIKFELNHLKHTPSFVDFIRLIKEKSEDKKNNGIIIQQPLPPVLRTESIYDFVDTLKEIEGHKKKTPFLPPVSLAVLTLFKYVYSQQKISTALLFDREKDPLFFKKIFKNKKIVLVGRGITGGKPIGKTLSEFKINFININSQTPNPGEYYKDADVIITAVGKKIINPQMLKSGVILINVGLRIERSKLKGDYEEKEIKDIASFYTPTPGGIGPLDVLYLYKNLTEATKLQK